MVAGVVEVDTADAAALLATGTTLALDVREPDEFEQGTLPLSIHIPRGHLEAQIESKITDKDPPIVARPQADCWQLMGSKS